MVGDTGEAAKRVDHWQHVFTDKPHDSVSWYAAQHATSVRLIGQADPVARVVDVGAGAGTLVDELLDAGWEDVTAQDVSAAALEAVRARTATRLVPPALAVADILQWRPQPGSFDVWHDRAVFHFMVEPRDQDAYCATLLHCLAPNGTAVIGTFAEDGPTQCSGLPTMRYTGVELAARFPDFRVITSEREDHHTPGGAIQPFTWVVLQRMV